MFKVQQKISGGFRSFEGADIFCCMRSYLSIAGKQNVSALKALMHFFKGNVPPFMAAGAVDDTTVLDQTN